MNLLSTSQNFLFVEFTQLLFTSLVSQTFPPEDTTNTLTSSKCKSCKIKRTFSSYKHLKYYRKSFVWKNIFVSQNYLSLMQLIKLLENRFCQTANTEWYCGKLLSRLSSVIVLFFPRSFELLPGEYFQLKWGGVRRRRNNILINIAICYTTIISSLSSHPRQNIYNAINYEVR